MEIVWDTETRTFALRRSRLQERFSSNSNELVHNLIRVILRPNNESTMHWITECNGFLEPTIGQFCKEKRMPIEYLFDSIADDCNSLKRFHLILTAVKLEADSIRGEEVYGDSRKLSANQVGIGLWIFYSLLNPYFKKYEKQDRDMILSNWYDIIKENPSEWIDRARISYKDVRCFSKFRRFPWQFNY